MFLLRYLNRTLLFILSTFITLPALAQLATIDVSDPTDPQVSYDEDPYLYPNIPNNPTVIYPEAAGTGALAGTTDPYTTQAPVVQTSKPDTYSTPAPKIYYTPPIDPPGPYFTSGVPMKFDFGPGPVASGYTQVRKATAYGPLLGYGWGDPTKVSEFDRGGADPLTRDFCRVGADATPFYVDVPNGNYRVSITVGDTNAKSNMTVRANGLFELASIGAAAGHFATDSFPIKVTTGRLRLEFFGAQAAAYVAQIDALTITPMTDADWNKPTIFLAGDSTVADYPPGNFIIGWGQTLPKFFTNDVRIDNQAKGGRSSRSFYEEGSLDVISNRIKPGDHLFVMFAINDSADETPNYRKTSPGTTFKAYLRKYVDAARSKGAIPVFVTSQIKCTYDLWGRFFNSVQGYPQAMRELGAELAVPVIDLNRMSIDDLTQIGPAEAHTCYATWPTDGHWDYIHPSEKGANRFAALVARGVKDVNLSVAQYLISLPNAPAGLVATAASTTEIDLSWTDTPRATGYNVKRSTVSGGPYTTIAYNVSATALRDTGLAPATTYYYVVSALNIKGESANSAETSAATPAGPPAASASVKATAGNSQVTLTWSASAGASSYQVKRSGSSGGPYEIVASPTTATFRDETVVNGVTYYYVESALNSYGESGNAVEVWATPAVHPLSTHWKFDEPGGASAVDDSGSGWDAVLVNGPLWTTGVLGSAVDLDGTNDYLSAPPGLAQGLNDFTVATWFNLDAAPTWSRIFDFGSGTGIYMFLTPSSSTGAVRFAITTTGNTAEQQINGTAPLPLGGWHHVAVTETGGVGVLYVDGVEVGRNTAMTITPASLGNTTQNWIGRSQWNDPFLHGRVDDFRIYNSALSAAEIASLANLGNTPPTISNIAGRTIAKNGSTGPISVTIGDAESAADSLTLGASSSNQALVQNSNITFGGSGTDRTVTITPAIGQTGSATIALSVTDGPLTSSTSFVLTVMAPPAIATQPQSQTVVVGDSVTFSVVATGSAPFSYQWRFNGTKIAGANDPTYTISSAQLANAGDYSVIVSNAVGMATSAAATLTVNMDAVFTGRATVLSANILGVSRTWSDTGPRPDSGGPQEATLLSLNESGLAGEVAHAFSLGQGDRTYSEASAANVILNAGGSTVRADFVMSRALAVWGGDGTVVSGTSEISKLSIGGQPIVVTGQPNQVVPLVSGRLILNEQITSSTEITVNAIHLMIDGAADIVVASAQAGFDSLTDPATPDGDHVSGGGWITGTPSGGKGTFGLDAGIESDESLSGHLIYKDQGNGLKINSTSITSYRQGTNANSRRIEGTAELNGVSGYTFILEVADNGEPGTNDTFSLSVSNGYQASGPLGGGNIQLH